MGKGGLEPPRLSTPDPKSGPSANSGTSPDVESPKMLAKNRKISNVDFDIDALQILFHKYLMNGG